MVAVRRPIIAQTCRTQIRKTLMETMLGTHATCVRDAQAASSIYSGATVCQLPDSALGYDRHDLPEVAPFGNYMTVVFPHPEWGDRSGDYTSDFHGTQNSPWKDSWTYGPRA